MSYTSITIIILIGIFLVFYILLIIVKSKIQKTLITFLKNHDFYRFDTLISKSIVKALFPPYNLEYLILNRYLLEDNKAKVDKQFEKLLRASKKSQKKDIFLKAFEYYAFNSDKKKAARYYNELNKLQDPKLTKYTDLIYDIFILDKPNHIEELENDFETLHPNQQKYYAQLLLTQYKLKGNKAKQIYYEDFLKNNSFSIL